MRLHPGDELGMEYDVFLECVSGFIHEIHMYVGVIRIDFATSLVYRQEYGFDAGSGLRHQACRACRCDGETGNVAAAVFLHLLVQFRVCFAQAVDERVVLFAFAVVYFESAAFFSHFHRRAVCAQCYGLVYFLCKFGSLFSAVTQSQCCKHVAFGGDAYAGAAALSALFVDFLPQNAFGMLYIFVFRIGVNFGHDTFYLLKFQVDDVVHDALGECYVLLEQIEIEVGIRFERIDYI